MNLQKLTDAIALAEKVGHVFIATCDNHGIPHVTAASRIAASDDDSVAVTEWFCPGSHTDVEQ
jgi:homoaconitase/3-isopropylmalate dehydratase large subunit